MEKIDLTPKLKRPMDTDQLGRDVAALNNLVGVLNNPNITGAEVPPGEDVRARPVPVGDPAALGGVLPQAAQQPQQAAPAAQPRDVSKVFYTGRLAVGKDYIAAATGAKIFGLADPIYLLVNALTGLNVTSTTGKDTPGVRTTLQTIGQWGRNEINEQYPITPARLVFCKMVESLAPMFAKDAPEVEWKKFGTDPDIWLKALDARVSRYLGEHPGSRVAITNVRFANEHKFLTSRGWTHYHVMCSPQTWQRRLAKQKMTPESPALKDMSEKLANFLDSDVITRISKHPNGGILRVIWNDADVKPPSNRFLTPGRFLQEIAIESATLQPQTGE